MIFCTLSNASLGPNAQIPFGTVIRRFGQSVRLDGPGITCCDQGYYDVDCAVTLTPETAGIYGVKLYAGQTLVSETSATATADSPVAVPIVGSVRQRCCGATSLSVYLASPDGVTTNTTVSMSSRVEKD